MTSFEFKWKNNNSGEKSTTAKVFAKRKLQPSNEKTKDLKSILFKKNMKESSDKLPTAVKKNRIKKTSDVLNKEKPFDNSQTFVKPNGRKDKVIALNVNSEDNETTKTNHSNAVPKNHLLSNKEKPFDNLHSLVKRKKRKDKVIASNINSEDNETTKTNHSNTGAKNHSLFSEKYKNIHINTNMKGKSVIEKVFSAGKKFGGLEIHKHLVSNLEKNNFNILTNVQEKSIPAVLSGQNVLIRSQTGSGKTLTYAIPVINALLGISPKLQRTDGCQVIIVVPTRELAMQTHELFSKLNTFQWIVVGHLCGGENRKTEKDRLRKGVHILIGTPGRLLDHILHTAAFNIKNVRCLVLDEADRLLDMGFKKDIVRLVEELDTYKSNSSYDPMGMLKRNSSAEETISTEEQNQSDDLPPLQNPKSDKRQTILLSATLTKGIAELADFTMKDHIYVDALDEASTTNPKHMVIPNTVKQEFIVTFVKHRLVMLSALLISKAQQVGKTFVFMATGNMVDFHYDLFSNYLMKMPKNRGQMKVGDVLLLDDIELDSDEELEDVLDIELFRLHGSMSQHDRKEVFNGFRTAKKGVLICTDVAARGIDVPEADCIVQYTGPQTDDDYLHRVGRTGRAGKSGSAIIFLTHEEQDFVSRLQEHKVFLKEHNTENYMKSLSIFMEEPDGEKATLALQKRYEAAISKDTDLHRKACFAYSSWSRFYSSFPVKMKSIFDLKKNNLGHYVTSFGLQDTPTIVARTVRGQVSKIEPKRLNKKLAIHKNGEDVKAQRQKRPIESLSLSTSEFSSGLESPRKKKNKSFKR